MPAPVFDLSGQQTLQFSRYPRWHLVIVLEQFFCCEHYSLNSYALQQFAFDRERILIDVHVGIGYAFAGPITTPGEDSEMTPTVTAKTSDEIRVALTMPVEAARQVIWQGRGPREPIGKLLDEKRIGHRDLAWAVDGAFNPRVREAARTLLANWLGQPATLEKTSRYGPEVVGGSQYLHDREAERLTDFAAYAGASIGIGSIVGMLTIGWIVTGGIQQLARLNFGLQVAAVAFVIGAVAWNSWYLYRQIRTNLEEYRNYRDGREGEEAALEKLRRALDHRWTIYRNLQLPGHKDDIDLVLVGPDGVWAIEVKSYKNTVRLQGAQWEVQKGKWTAMRENPTMQVTRNATRLKSYLEQYGMRRYVHGAIVLEGPHPISNFKTSESPVWLLTNLEGQVTSLNTQKPPSEKEIGQIVQALKKVAEKVV